MEIFRINLL